jgi:hypothetical protein
MALDLQIPVTPFAIVVSSDSRLTAAFPVRRTGQPAQKDFGDVEEPAGIQYANMVVTPKDPQITNYAGNRVPGSCTDFRKYSWSEGVVVSEKPFRRVMKTPNDGPHDELLGATTVPTKFQKKIIAGPVFYGAGFLWKGYCKFRPNTIMTDEAVCTNSCVGANGVKVPCLSLALPKTFCASAKYTIGIKVRGWAISTLVWVPKVAKCQKNANRVNALILAHELRHVDSDREAAKALTKDFDLQLCGPSQSEVMANHAKTMEYHRNEDGAWLISVFESMRPQREAAIDNENSLDRIHCDSGC